MRGGAKAALAMAVLLAGCGRGGPGGVVAGAFAGPEAGQAKLNAYTEGFNTVLGTFGLRGEYESYQKAGIGGPHPDPQMAHLIGGWLDQAQIKLKAARAMPGGGLGDVDAAADRFIPALDKVMTHEAALKSYYASKAWRDDGLARGKAEDGPLTAEFRTAISEADRFDAVLTHARDQRDAQELARLKSSGDMLGYDTQIALKHGRALAQLFHSEADLHDPAKTAAAETEARALQAALADQHAEVAKAKPKASGPDQWRVDSYGRAGDELDSELGAYRDLKGGGGQASYQSMISSFNSAVSGVNAVVTTSAALGSRS